jgi:hypothetical protein
MRLKTSKLRCILTMMASRVRIRISVIMGYWNAKESNDDFKHRYFRFAFAFVSYRASSIAIIIILRLVENCLQRTETENCTRSFDKYEHD